MLAKIFDGAYLKRLDNIKQWQEMDVFKEESVSQHSYKVSIFGRILLEDIFGDSKSVEVLKFKLDCIDAFAFHDWDEALILRDMSHETKYNNYNGQQIRDALDNLSRHKAIEEFSEYESDGPIMASDKNNHGILTDSSKIIINNITNQIEDVKMFCKLSDWLALIFYMKRERELGNKSLNDQWNRSQMGLLKNIEAVKIMLNHRFHHMFLNYSELDKLNNNIYGK